ANAGCQPAAASDGRVQRRFARCISLRNARTALSACRKIQIDGGGMTLENTPSQVQLIPIEHITVVNPRVRNQRVFKGIIENIAEIGLKKPITVTRRSSPDGPRYDLVCGQGRLEAFQA